MSNFASLNAKISPPGRIRVSLLSATFHTPWSTLGNWLRVPIVIAISAIDTPGKKSRRYCHHSFFASTDFCISDTLWVVEIFPCASILKKKVMDQVAVRVYLANSKAPSFTSCDLMYV